MQQLPVASLLETAENKSLVFLIFGKFDESWTDENRTLKMLFAASFRFVQLYKASSGHDAHTN